MSHIAVVNAERRLLGELIALPTSGGPLRLHRTSAGDAVVISAVAATRDGVPLLGNLGVVDWGTAALVRAREVRVELLWQPQTERRVAPAGWRCRICFAPIAAGDEAVLCSCTQPFDAECEAVRISCPACGALRGEAAA
jgi:hypothetical protein